MEQDRAATPAPSLPTSPDDPHAASRWARWRREVALVAVLAVVSSTVAIQFSRDVGKLAFLPFYDDVTYLTEAQKRVHAIYENGLRAWPRAMLSPADPFRERSGFLINLGVLAFLLLGRETGWAPYAALGAFVLAGLVLLRVLFREYRFRAFVVAAICLLCVPVARGWTIEFRPDITWGFALGLVAAFVLRDLGRHPVRIGVGAAVATLFKPTALPVSLAVVLAALGIALAASWRRGFRGGPAPRDVLRFGAGWAVGLAVLGFATIPAALRYTYGVLFVSSAPWIPGSGLRFALAYYVTGAGGRWAFGALAPFLLLVVAAAAGLLAARRARSELAFGAGMLGVTAAAYAIVSASAVKTVLIGSVFYALVALVFFQAALVLAEAAAGAAEGVPAIWTAAVVALVVPSLFLTAPGPRLPDHPFLERGSVAHADAEAVNRETYRVAVEARGRSGGRSARLPHDLAVVSFGPAVSAWFEYQALLDNRPLDVVDLSGADEASLRARLPEMLCVSIADDALEWIRFADRRNAGVIELLRGDPSFELRYRRDIGRPGGPGGGSYFAFCRAPAP